MHTPYLAGYARTLTGGGFPYHAPQPDATTALLIRSESDAARIAWLTDPVPAGEPTGFVQFLLLANIALHPEDPHRWTMRIMERDAIVITTPPERAAREQRWNGIEGASLELTQVEIDKYGDLMGYAILTIPRAWTRPDESVSIEVRGEGAGSRTWFMVYEYAARDRVTVVPVPAVRRDPAGPRQVLRVEVVRYTAPRPAVVTVGPHRFGLDLRFGYNVGHLDVPEITEPLTLPVHVDAQVEGTRRETLHAGEVTLRPVVRRSIHLLAHSHVDIGYTHHQDEVERLQWSHLESALALARRTQEYPPGARFRWNSEVTWAVDSYLRTAPEAEREALLAGIRAGWIELDALYANELTALCSPAELCELTEAARRIARDAEVEPRAAMITDIPGFTWSLVPVLAQSGVRYFSVGPNRGHRVGHMTGKLGDRPFWWVSPSGEERVLCWVHSEGYSLFHTKMYAERIDNRLDESTLLPCLERLEAAGYPFETAVLRYTVAGDNGPPHAAMPEVVRDWNERFLTPRLSISTVTEAFGALEREAGDRLPELRGDLTAYWEDGAASTALELAINRGSAERLRQAEIAAALIAPEAYDAEVYRAAWREVLLFDEHTWGSWNSISEPDAELTRVQWEAKRSYALRAEATSHQRLAEAIRPHAATDRPVAALEVINTELWTRTDLVRASVAGFAPGSRLLDDEGREVPSQRLSTGELVFVARDVPPLGSLRYRVEPSGPTPTASPAFRFHDDGLESGEFAAFVDRGDGSLRSLFWKRTGRELGEPGARPGLNGYIYVEGRDPSAPLAAGDVQITPGELGPVLASLRVTSAAPGCEQLAREIVLVKGLERVDLIDTLQKTAVRNPEAARFAFPLHVPGGTARFDLALGVCRVEDDQIPGGNRNYVTAAYAADVSNETFGVTLACPDAPLLEVGGLWADPIVVGWLERLNASARFYSYAMNNYWETNYRAEQPGRVRLRYRLQPHGPLSLPAMRRTGLAARRPLLVVPVRREQPPLASLPSPIGSGFELVALRPTRGGWLMVLCNLDDRPAELLWGRPPGRVRRCDLDGSPGAPAGDDLQLPPFGVRAFRIDS